MWKFGGRTRLRLSKKIKMFIKKLQDENEEFKGNITWLKLQDQELQDLKQKVTIWETIKRKWIEALFLHKKQQEVLDSQVKTLTKEKEENVLTNLELVNLNNVFMLQSEELRRKATKAKKTKLLEETKEYQKYVEHLQTQFKMAQEQRKSLDPTGVKKKIKL